MPRFNLDSFNYNPLTNRSNAAIDSAMRNVDAADARMWERRSSNPKPQSRKSTKRRGAGYRKRNVQQPKPVAGDSVTVQVGDSLSAILKRTTGSYKNVAEVARLNGIKDPNKIYVGQKIKIPGYKADAGGDVVVGEETGGIKGDRNINTTANKAGVALRNLIAKGQQAAAATSVVKDSVAAPKDTTTVVRNDSVPAAPRDSVTTTVPADTTSESGYERARAHAMQLLKEREAKKQREAQQRSVAPIDKFVMPKYAKEHPELYSNIFVKVGNENGRIQMLQPTEIARQSNARNAVIAKNPRRKGESMEQYSKRLDREVQLADMARKSGAVKPVWPEKYVLGGGALGKALRLFRGAKTVVDNAPQNAQNVSQESQPGVIIIGGGKPSSTSQDIPVVVTNNKKSYNPPLSTVKPKSNPKGQYTRPRTTNIKPRQTHSVNTHVGVSTTKPKASTPTRVNTRRWSGTSGWSPTRGWGQPGKGGWQSKPVSTQPKAEPKPVDIKPTSTANKKWKATSQHKQARGWQYVKRRR